MIIDFHTHIFPQDIVNNRDDYLKKDILFQTLYKETKAKLTTAEDLVSNMDRFNIQKSVVLNIAWGSHELCVKNNDYILDSVSRYPDRLIGFCMVNFISADESIKEIERCWKSGAKGIGEIRLNPEQITSESMIPIVKYIINHKLILLTHSSEPLGHLYPGKGVTTPELLYQFITKFPGLKLVCAHWGGGLPFYALMPKVNPFFDNLYFDSAASPFLYNPQVYSQVAELTGMDKILFGSDYPLLSPGRLLNEIESLNLSEGLKKAILSYNACKLLGIVNQGK
jgi:uncharacterized protein